MTLLKDLGSTVGSRIVSGMEHDMKHETWTLINKMINELAVYQIQSNECLLSDMKDKEVLENIIEFWSEIASSLERVRPPLLFAATDIS